MATDPVVVADPILNRLVNWWKGHCEGREMPSRGDLHPADIRELLPDLVLVECSDHEQFRYRLVGTRIDRNLGMAVTGRWLDQLPCDDLRQLSHHYGEVVRARRPLCFELRGLVDGRRYVHYRHVCAPLSADGATVDHLIGAVHFLKSYAV